jgi:hypothetical protein
MKLKHAGTFIFGGSLDALAGLSQLQQQRGTATPVARSVDEKVTRDVSAPTTEIVAAPVVDIKE